MPMFAHHLFILGLVSCESMAALKSAYRSQMQRWHPDRHHNNPSMIPAATERARQINEAYDHLSKTFESGTPSSATGVPRSTARKTRKRKTRGRPTFAPGFPDPEVGEFFVESSHILSAGFSQTKGILYLKFRDQAIYGYFDVPEAVFTKFMEAESHGRFAQRHVLESYRSERFS